MILRLILHPFLSQRPQIATGGFIKDALQTITQKCYAGNPHLADAGQFGEQHLENWRWQRLLEYLKQLLRLTTYCNRIGQVVYTALELTYFTVRKGLEN